MLAWLLELTYCHIFIILEVSVTWKVRVERLQKSERKNKYIKTILRIILSSPCQVILKKKQTPWLSLTVSFITLTIDTNISCIIHQYLVL